MSQPLIAARNAQLRTASGRTGRSAARTPSGRTASSAPRRPNTDVFADRVSVRVISPPSPARFRMPLPLACLLLMTLGLLGLLLTNIAIAGDAYRITSLQVRSGRLADQQQSVQESLDALAAPQNLAERATELDMVPAPSTVHLTERGPVGAAVPAAAPMPAPVPAAPTAPAIGSPTEQPALIPATPPAAGAPLVPPAAGAVPSNPQPELQVAPAPGAETPAQELPAQELPAQELPAQELPTPVEPTVVQ